MEKRNENKGITPEEFEEIWQSIKAEDERIQAEFDALPAKEKERISERYNDSFYERISDDLIYEFVPKDKSKYKKDKSKDKNED